MSGRPGHGIPARPLDPRICRILYGTAAAAIEPVIAANLSLQSDLAGGPDGEDFADPGRYVAEQAAARERLRAGLAKFPAGNGWVDFWRQRLEQARPAPARPVRTGGSLRLVEVKRSDQTVTYGYATVLSFRIEPATQAAVEIRDARGKTLATVQPRSARVLVDLSDVVHGDLVVKTGPSEFRVDEKGAVR